MKQKTQHSHTHTYNYTRILPYAECVDQKYIILFVWTKFYENVELRQFFLGKHKTHKTGSLRIYKGTPVEISEVPFVARLVSDDLDLYCGAVIINKKFLLTTAVW